MKIKNKLSFKGKAMTKKVLITGSAGFIGFHTAKTLKKQGYDIVGIDNFNSYYDPQLKEERADILKDLGVTTHRLDICDLEGIRSVIQAFQPTHLIHLAAQAGVRYSIEAPQEYIKSNVEGFLNILEICREYPKTPLVYASSSSVYGLNTNSPFSIEDRTDKQASLYGATKKSNELMAQTYHHLYGIQSTGLRFFHSLWALGTT